MARTVATSYQTPADALRKALDRLENLVVKPNAQSIEELLVTLDQAEVELDLLEGSGIDVRSERVRWENLLNRISSKPELITAAASGVTGGLAALRTAHPPAESFWWHADAQRAERQRRGLTRFLVTVVALIVLLAGAYWLFNTLFPPDPTAVAYIETASKIEQAIDADDYPRALAVVQEALKSNPDVELVLWAAVLAERTGDETLAQQYKEQAQTALQATPAAFWISLGNKRLRAYDSEGASAAAQEALKILPEDGESLLLAGRAALTLGDRQAALDYLDRAYLAAGEENPQLAVSARVLYGELLRQIELPGESMKSTDTTSITATLTLTATSTITTTSPITP